MSSSKFIINGHFRTQRVTGVQRYAHEVISQFDKENISYDWVQPPRKLQSDSLRQLWMQTVMPFKIPANSLLWSPTNVGPVYREHQLLTLHDIADQLYPEWFDPKYVRWRQLILPGLLKRVRGIITVSEFSKRTIAQLFPGTAEKIRVIYNGVRIDHFYPRTDNEIEGVREDLGLHKPFVLNVGSLDPRKNTSRLIKAWGKLQQSIRNEMDLVIAGGGAQQFAFHHQKSEDENVRFIGYVNNKQLPVLYSAAEVFVYPSLFEGFGLPVLEAMACKTPVITSDKTALKEISGPAVTVDPISVEEIRSALEKLIQSPAQRSRMKDRGLKWASRFRWEHCAKQTYNYIKKIS
ncbi:MAG TPA: glycosyltransferase family 1 protein [Balneolaceae bacterium]|nr:glycosyltransferase family 1 protein [Balneolaceae bacterium]